MAKKKAKMTKRAVKKQSPLASVTLTKVSDRRLSSIEELADDPGAKKADEYHERVAAAVKEAKLDAPPPSALDEIDHTHNIHPQLQNYPVPGTHYLTLGPKPGIKSEQLHVDARVQMAARLNSLAGKLPRYVDKAFLARAAQEAEQRAARKARTRSDAPDEGESERDTDSTTKESTMAKKAKKGKKANGVTAVAAHAATKAKTPSAATAKRSTGGFSPEQKITWAIKENPRSKGGATHARFAKYFGAKTVADYLAKGGTVGDLRWDVKHKYLSLSK